jgi:hypothetical protein
MPMNVTAGMATRRLAAALACASIVAGAACTQVVAESSACRKLEYKNGSVPRAQYLPCAGEIIAALDELDRQTEAAFGGDRQARSDGQSTLRRVIALTNAAGGRQLLERWDDRVLTDLNVDIHNAVTHYQAFYMVRILEEPNQFAETSRTAAKNEFVGGHRRYDEARRLYQRLN